MNALLSVVLALCAAFGSPSDVSLGPGTWFKVAARGRDTAFVKHHGQRPWFRLMRDGAWITGWQLVHAPPPSSPNDKLDEPEVEPFWIDGERWWMVVWTYRGPSGGKQSITAWCRVYDDDGAPASVARPVPDLTAGWQPGTSSWLAKPAAIPPALGGGCRIAYTRGFHERACYTDHGVHGPLSIETVVSPFVAGDCASMELAVAPDGRWLFSWMQWTGPHAPRVLARVDDGAPWEVRPSSTPQRHPSVAWSRGVPAVALQEGGRVRVVKGAHEADWPGQWSPQLASTPSGRMVLSFGQGPISATRARVLRLGRNLVELGAWDGPVADSGPWESWPDSGSARGGRTVWAAWGASLQGRARLLP